MRKSNSEGTFNPYHLKTDTPINSAAINDPVTAAAVISEEMRHMDKELFMTAFLNNRDQLIGAEIMNIGSTNSCSVDVSGLMRHAVTQNAASIICYHNHPAGNPVPSQADYDITKRISDACSFMGIGLVDHIILGSVKFYSMRAECIYRYGDVPLGRLDGQKFDSYIVSLRLKGYLTPDQGKLMINAGDILTDSKDMTPAEQIDFITRLLKDIAPVEELRGINDCFDNTGVIGYGFNTAASAAAESDDEEMEM